MTTIDPIVISICSPVHNEEPNLRELVARVHAVLQPRFGDRMEQILVDDGSTDESADLIRQLQTTHSNLVLLQHATNQGERAAWKTAFDAARGDVVVLMAADLQSQPEDLPGLIDVVLDEGYDVASGERVRRRDGTYYWLATRILNAYMCRVFSLDVRDVSSSFFAARKELVKNLDLVNNDHRYILALFRKRGARIEEVPITHAARKAGDSHYSKLKVLAAIPELIRFTWRYYRGDYGPSR